jgi:hypothetical protein
MYMETETVTIKTETVTIKTKGNPKGYTVIASKL